jgi:uncharacterized protein
MKIQVASLSQGPHHFQFRVPAADLGLGTEFSGEVLVDAALEKTSTQIFLNARVSAEGTFSCDRCVAEFPLSLSPSYRMCYVWEGAGAAGLDPAEVQVVPGGLTVIDITDDVRQTVVLAVPLKLLCREDCKGLCADCGANLNLESCRCGSDTSNPRWDGLNAIRTSQS